MKEDVRVGLRQRNSVVTCNPLENSVVTIGDFLATARVQEYKVAEFSDGMLIAYRPPHNVESACASIGKRFIREDVIKTYLCPTKKEAA